MSDPYEIGPADAVYLLALLSGENVPARSNADLLNLLKNVLRLSQSLNDNCREWLEVCAIVHGDMHPYSAEKLNIPTLTGALHAAVSIPRVNPCAKMCHTCAFRVGSPANQTEATASDIFDCLQDKEIFFCHDVESDDAPKKPCRGFLAAFREQKSPSDV